MLDRLAERLHVRNPRALSRAIMEMVADGELPPGTRMPTVREIAKELGMSPASVAAAWRELVDWRVIETQRRGGTRILGPALGPRATRYEIMMKAAEGIPLNLGNLTPDRDILPPLDRALAAAAASQDINENLPTPITQALLEAVEPVWPFTPQHMMATHGGIAAALLALETNIRPGDRVIVDSPTVSRVLDMLESLGARPVPIPQGVGGPDLETLARAITMRPAAMVYQPVGNHPTGLSVTSEWIGKAADLLKDMRMPIIELVQAPLMHAQPWLSLGTFLPHMVVHVHAYFYFAGADIRVGVVGGSDYYIDRMWQKLTFSSGWISRIPQNVLAFQLSDPRAREDVTRYVDTLRNRHKRMLAALRAVGFDLPETDGPPIWLPVPNDYVVTHQLSSRGIVVHPGSYFSPDAQEGHHVLVNGTVLETDQEDIARTIARIVGLSV